MGIFKDDTDYSHIKPQPYKSLTEEEQERERDATEIHAPLTEEQQKTVREQTGINPITQTITDVLKQE